MFSRAETEQMFRQTVLLYKKVLGAEHPDTLTVMSNLALAVHSQGKYEAAEAMHRETLALRRRVLGDKHPDTRSNINNLASVLRSQGKHADGG
jgi:hypothetical protein